MATTTPPTIPPTTAPLPGLPGVASEPEPAPVPVGFEEVAPPPAAADELDEAPEAESDAVVPAAPFFTDVLLEGCQVSQSARKDARSREPERT